MENTIPAKCLLVKFSNRRKSHSVVITIQCYNMVVIDRVIKFCEKLYSFHNYIKQMSQYGCTNIELFEYCQASDNPNFHQSGPFAIHRGYWHKRNSVPMFPENFYHAIIAVAQYNPDLLICCHTELTACIRLHKYQSKPFYNYNTKNTSIAYKASISSCSK